jgi:dTDP-4-amino-4,6-dideoxygalactose transaminase
MKEHRVSRRRFLSATSTTAIAATGLLSGFKPARAASGTLALKGGAPLRTKKWPAWPNWYAETENPLLQMFRTGNWFRGSGEHVAEFEQAYAALMGSRRCLATASGTTALVTAMHVLGVDAGDEVIVSPYTFIASYNAVFLLKALPVFADTDPETMTIDPKAIPARITDRTKAILPVHILGLPVDMDPVLEIARQHNLVVVEDACQAWLAEYKNKKCGTMGDLGCFSFQNSKHLPAGEGGAIIGDSDVHLDRCYSFHNCGRAFGTSKGDSAFYTRGSNFRMQQSQAIILMSQMKRLEKDTRVREQNAHYLAEKVRHIPGIHPFKLNKGVTRAVFHLFPFRYVQNEFDDIPKEKFLQALQAEGVPCSTGYGPQYRDGLIEEALSSTGYQRLFSQERLKRYRDELVLPKNDQLCRESVWFTQNLLLGSQADMDDIANAIQKIYDNRAVLAKM